MSKRSEKSRGNFGTKNVNSDIGLGCAFDVREVVHFARVGSSVCSLHVADGDGGVHGGSQFRTDVQSVCELWANYILS